MSNPFAAVFKYMPRSRLTPKENFLTEALVYTLRVSKPAAKVWLKLMTKEHISTKEVNFSTQTRFKAARSRASQIPDVMAEIVPRRGKKIRVLVEQKWDSRLNHTQLRRYAALGNSKERLFLSAVYADRRDDEIARSFRCRKSVSYSPVRWSEIYSAFRAIKRDKAVLQFLHFLDFADLAPGRALTQQDVLGFVSKGFRDSDDGHDVRKKFMHYCHRLADEKDWNSIPNKLKQYPYFSDGWGRCAVGVSWGANLTLGFLYDTADHKVKFINDRLGVDLALRVLAPPRRGTNLRGILDVLSKTVPLLKRRGAVVHLHGDDESKNRHTIYLARRPLWEVIRDAKTEDEQIEVIYRQLSQWCKALFTEDVVKAVRKLPKYE